MGDGVCLRSCEVTQSRVSKFGEVGGRWKRSRGDDDGGSNDNLVEWTTKHRCRDASVSACQSRKQTFVCGIVHNLIYDYERNPRFYSNPSRMPLQTRSDQNLHSYIHTCMQQVPKPTTSPSHRARPSHHPFAYRLQEASLDHDVSELPCHLKEASLSAKRYVPALPCPARPHRLHILPAIQ